MRKEHLYIFWMASAIRIISLIEDRQVIREILTHLGLWLVRVRTTEEE